ncbi:DUF1093 domain-containing protein (plasmid) [Bacillus sp. JAS24-2]|nr:DUF1093 domain-containing protein [Bacillus sp. JAS24-2]
MEVKDYYLVVKADDKNLGEGNRNSYECNLKGFDIDVKEQNIIIDISKKLLHGTHLKVTEKGKNNS